MLNKEIEKLLDCSNCNLKECIACEITYTDKQKIKKYIELLESKLETNKIGLDEMQKEAIKIAEEKNELENKLKQVIKELKVIRNNIEKNEFVGYADEIQDIIQTVEGE